MKYLKHQKSLVVDSRQQYQVVYKNVPKFCADRNESLYEICEEKNAL